MTIFIIGTSVAPKALLIHSRQDIPSRKAARSSTLTALAQRFNETLKSLTGSLPTPESREYRVSSANTGPKRRLLQLLDTSPTPGRLKDTASPGLKIESGLTTAILKLIHPNNLKLKLPLKCSYAMKSTQK